MMVMVLGPNNMGIHRNTNPWEYEKNGVLMGFFSTINAVLMVIYPLVNIQKAIENDHRNSGFSH